MILLVAHFKKSDMVYIFLGKYFLRGMIAGSLKG